MEGLDVVVFGPVDALARLRILLRETGDLVEADPVVPDDDDPTHGSCFMRMTRPGGGPETYRTSGRRGSPAGFLAPLAAFLRRPADQARRHPPQGPGRHRANNSVG